MSQPTEPQILTSYLLHPAPLPTILPFNAFVAIAPSSHRAHPSLRPLYLDLQLQRSILVDDARIAIERECARSTALTAQLTRDLRRENGILRGRKRKRNQVEETDDASDEHDDGTSSSDRSPSPNISTADRAFDTTFSGPRGVALPAASRNTHFTSTGLLNGLATARTDIRSEIAVMEAEMESLYARMAETVGGLSDLRYGRFTTGMSGRTLEGEAERELQELAEVLRSGGGG